jgi:NAD+ synthase
MFNAEYEINYIIDWIRDYFKDTNAPAVIGISGGKDSSIAAALCAAALGPERVYGVLMPQGTQHDIDVARALCEHLGIHYMETNIEDTCRAIYGAINSAYRPTSDEGFNCLDYDIVTTNTPARIRMTVLYAIAGMLGGRVVNTCNRSEEYVGYSTKFGDAAGDFSPLKNYTVSEILWMGELLLPSEYVYKTPEDGMSGKTDEEKLGFTYTVLDALILDGVQPTNYEEYRKIMKLHETSEHKRQPMPTCPNSNEEGDVEEFKNGRFTFCK